MSVGVWRVSVGVCRVSGGVIGGYKTHMNSQNPRYNQYNHTSGFLPVPPNHSNYLKWSKFSDPMYGGSNELFDKNQNFPLFLNIKLHLKMPVNFNFLNILSFLGKSVPPLPRRRFWTNIHPTVGLPHLQGTLWRGQEPACLCNCCGGPAVPSPRLY